MAAVIDRRYRLGFGNGGHFFFLLELQRPFLLNFGEKVVFSDFFNANFTNNQERGCPGL